MTLTAPSPRSLFEPRRPCGYPFPHEPSPKQRAVLLLTNERELFYGGSAGGGKSYLALFEAMQYVCVPGYSSILLRQTSPQLHGSEGLVPLSHEWFGRMPGAVWRADDMIWTFTGLDGQPAGQVRFGHAERDVDKFKFSGHAYHHAFFDELTQWATNGVFEFIGYSRMRKPRPSPTLRACPGCGLTLADVPLRLRGAGNPGGIGHNWVRSRYAIQLEGEPLNGARFMPARLSDNKHMSPEYAEDLKRQNAVNAARLLDGDWQVVEAGRMFQRSWFLA